jgi:hypothetical protein
MFSLEDVLPDLFELLEGVMGSKKKTRHQHQKSR